MNEQFIQWTHEGEKKMVLLELGEECTVKEVKPINVEKTAVEDFEKVNQIEEVPEPKHIKRKDKGNCNSCEENKKRNGLLHLAKGGAKLLKAQLGVDASDESTIIDRKNICESCEHYDFGVCQKCGCFCSAKVRLKSEVCPEGRW